ncbi:MAG: peptidase S9 [Myxococcaceae bacterium]
MIASLLVVSLLAPAPAPAAAPRPPAAPAKHPYSVKDQVTLSRVLSFALSPDHRRVVYALRKTDLEANRGRSDLWLVNVDGSGSRQLTTHEANDTDPVWAPDNVTVYFLSTRSGSSQVWKLNVDGGEAAQVTRHPLDVDAFVLSRDGTQLGFSAEVFPDCETLACTKQRLDEKAKEKATGRLYDALLYRHWDTWRDGRRSHLFAQALAGGEPVDVMKKASADAPPKPFGDAHDFTFTPDGKGLVFTARWLGREEAWSTNLDLFLAPVDGKKAPLNLTKENAATDSLPVFSPDGTRLAWLAMKRPGFEADRRAVMVRDWPSGKPKELAPTWDRSADSLAWSVDSKQLFVTAEHLGQVGAFSLDVADGKLVEVYARGSISAVAATPTQLVVQHDSLTSAADLYTVPKEGGGALLPVTQVNSDAFQSFTLGQPEQFSFTGADGATVYGYVVKPVGFDAKKKYPLAFLIHGGPQGSFGNHWHYRWNPQTYAGHGYVAVMIDFHGSTGYGQAFTDSISQDWGGKPLEDLRKGLAAAAAKYPFIDQKRMCALGASYGGYMVNWIAGVWNEPWKCLVSHDGNLDERFAYFDTEELWFPEWDHGGTPWDNPNGYARHNPVEHVGSWKVPMLVVHGGQDFRVVESQGMATFTALQRRGIPSRFLYFPDENHWVLKPANSILWHDTVLGWLDQWTKAAK